MSGSDFDLTPVPQFPNSSLASYDLKDATPPVIDGDTIDIGTFDVLTFVLKWTLTGTTSAGTFVIQAVPLDDAGAALAPAVTIVTCITTVATANTLIVVLAAGTEPDMTVLTGCTIGLPELLRGFNRIQLQLNITTPYNGTTAVLNSLKVLQTKKV